MNFNKTLYQISLGITILIIIILAVFLIPHLTPKKVPIALSTYEFYDQRGTEITSFQIQYPSNWILRAGNSNALLYSNQNLLQVFLPLEKDQLREFSPVLSEKIIIDGKEYEQHQYIFSNSKAIFIEDFTFGVKKGIGFFYEDEAQKAEGIKILTSIKFQ